MVCLTKSTVLLGYIIIGVVHNVNGPDNTIGAVLYAGRILVNEKTPDLQTGNQW